MKKGLFQFFFTRLNPTSLAILICVWNDRGRRICDVRTDTSVMLHNTVTYSGSWVNSWTLHDVTREFIIGELAVQALRFSFNEMPYNLFKQAQIIMIKKNSTHTHMHTSICMWHTRKEKQQKQTFIFCCFWNPVAILTTLITFSLYWDKPKATNFVESKIKSRRN